ncbi:MAG TPA: GAF domain-containing protein [Candidatus Atribacteria bacterium]|nr:GAF domain-containing protein [Candidatus Atribacteria bacterium]HPT78715.1 GAF domain-containing protein [Candidatus Atribacteria bacterium]
MFKLQGIKTNDKHVFYEELNTYLKGLISDDPDWLAGLANAASLLFLTLENINWAGFYLLKGNELVLGPFHGKPACVRIPLGKGVCGTAADIRQIQVVKDVHLFPGHIACDEASRSEIVVPIIARDRLIGVLDIDSPVLARFDEDDAKGLSQFVDILDQNLAWPESFV